MKRVAVGLAVVFGLTGSAMAAAGAVETLQTPLPPPPPGKAEVQVLCRQSPGGLLSDCRAVRSASNGYPTAKDAEAKVEGTSGPPPAKGVVSAFKTVEVDLPAGPPATAGVNYTDWELQPSPAALTAVFPRAAQKTGLAGE